MSKVYINGRLVPAGHATISVFDRGYLYGEGVFESLRVRHGVPLFAELHRARLRDNCHRLGIPCAISSTQWRTMLMRLIRAHGAINTALRVTVSVGSTAAVSPAAHERATNVVAFLRPPIQRPRRVYQQGARVILIRSVVADAPEIATVKSTNYLSKLLARHEVARARADEGLLCTARGEVVEGTFTNLFAVRRGVLSTPPVASGLLPGITRRLVQLCAQCLQIPQRETRLTVTDLRRADELFLTGSTSAVLPIRMVQGVGQCNAPGPITRRLMAAYQTLVDTDVRGYSQY